MNSGVGAGYCDTESRTVTAAFALRSRSWACIFALCLWAIAPTACGDEHLANAAKRIDKHRQADAYIDVLDSAGVPIPNAEVTIEQTSHAFLFGCNIFSWGRLENESDEQVYRDRFAELFNYATLPFYWASYEPRRGQPDHDRTERIARWCRDKGIHTKGHPLAWNYADPVWLPDDLTEICSLQMDRIDDSVGRFRNLINRWDVVNEATHFERDAFQKRAPKMTGMWTTVGRSQFVRDCFRHARSANPKATLLINDYRTDAPYEVLLEKLRHEDGQPIFDVIGIQSHMHGGTWSNQKIWDVCERYAKFNVPLHFTETTILSGQSGWQLAQPWPSTPAGERLQADEVERIYTLLFSHPSVEAVTWWDLSDRAAWQQAPAGLLHKDLSAKPAYDRLRKLVKEQWWTQLTRKTDNQGRASFRGFLGKYKVTVIADNKTVVKRITLSKNVSNELAVTVPEK